MDTREYFNSLAGTWDSIVQHDPQKLKKIIDLTDIKEGDTVLDVGCGTGVLEGYLLEKILTKMMVEDGRLSFKESWQKRKNCCC